MKKLFTFLLFALISTISTAQVIDTILFENFQTDKFPEWGTVPLGNDTTWVTFDEDGLTPYDSDDNHRAWYHSTFFYNAEDTITGDINYCASSLSFMLGFLEGNRNWLITPPIHVNDANFTLHWKSAPFQLPRYLDGYLVLGNAGSNDIFNDQNFKDTLFQASSMLATVGNGSSVLIHNFSFTPGYIHADSLKNEDYFDLWEPGDSTLCHGILEPHSVSLAQYAGQTVYFAFLHNADDDYFLAIDDVLITKSSTSSANDLNGNDFRFVTYPNPVVGNLNVMYRLQEPAAVTLRVFDTAGKLMMTTGALAQQAGEQQSNLFLGKMPPGSYVLSLQVGEKVLTKVFQKQ
jgi:Secretion system C-terminal sorting domain